MQLYRKAINIVRVQHFTFSKINLNHDLYQFKILQFFRSFDFWLLFGLHRKNDFLSHIEEKHPILYQLVILAPITLLLYLSTNLSLNIAQNVLFLCILLLSLGYGLRLFLNYLNSKSNYRLTKVHHLLHFMKSLSFTCLNLLILTLSSPILYSVLGISFVCFMFIASFFIKEFLCITYYFVRKELHI